MAGFGLPNFGQLIEAFKKAKQIQQDAQKLQDELENMEIEGKSDDEMIKVWISGNQLPLKVEVQENILNANKEQIERTILQAIQKAHELSTTTMKERMNDLTGGLILIFLVLIIVTLRRLNHFSIKRISFEGFI